MRRHSVVPPPGVVTAVPALLLAVLLAGCGTDTAGDDAPATATDPVAFDVTTATVTAQPFCDQVDATIVAPALDMGADRVKLLESREVGQKVEGPDEEEGPLVSEVNSCTYGSSTARFIVTVRPDAPAEEVQKKIDYYADLGHKGFSSETCTVEEDSGFGEPGAVARCHGTGGSQRTSVVATGLVGTSSYFCSAVLNSGGSVTSRDATVDACRTTLETLSAAGK